LPSMPAMGEGRRDHGELRLRLGARPRRRAGPAGVSPEPSRYHRGRPGRARPRTAA
jgi:hypothetical protein